MTPDWLSVRRADTPLILAMPHGGTFIPDDLIRRSGREAMEQVRWAQ